MELRTIEHVTDEIYHKSIFFKNISIYHTRPWHQFIHRTFGWSVKAILGYSARNQLAFYFPFVSKKRFGKITNIGLPLSHKVNLAYDPNWFSISDAPSVNLKVVISDLEIHDKIDLECATKSYHNDITVLKLDKFKTEQDIFDSFDYKSIRYMIKKAIRNNIKIINNTDNKTISDFYSLIIETRHRQGSPLYPRNFFQNLKNAFCSNDQLVLSVAYHDRIPISGTIFFYFQDHAIYSYSASVNDKKIKRLGANELLVWNGIRRAFNMGKKYIDFGTSPRILPGLKSFKEKWGGTSSPLIYTYIGNDIKKPLKVKRDSDIIKWGSNFLRLMPVSMFQRISPFLFRWVI